MQNCKSEIPSFPNTLLKNNSKNFIFSNITNPCPITRI
uniref:Uncharacterized protein n=1 Tax=Rhizophora mucronata TaxID=61149 RepID=A0A2P2Q7F4_RHIMU